MKSLIVILVVFVGCGTKCYPQGQVIGLERGAKSKPGSKYYNYYVTRWDEATGGYDTIVAFTGITNSTSTIDPFNGRYFLMGSADTALRGGNLITVDLNTNTIKTSVNDFVGHTIDMNYDIFHDRIIYRSYTIDQKFALYSYDLKKGGIDTLTPLPPFSNMGGRHNLYNPFTEEYISINPEITGNNILIANAVTVNTAKKTITHNLILDTALTDIAVDLFTQKYYGLSGNTVFEFDPKTGKAAPILYVSSMLGHLNEQQNVFDVISGYYIEPALSSPDAKLFYVDVRSGGVLVKRESYKMEPNLQEYYWNLCAFIKQDEINARELIATYGKSYRWYKDGVIIPDAIGQVYAPIYRGLYSAEVVSLSGEVVQSNVLYFDITGTEAVNVKDYFSVFPNPAKTLLNIDMGSEEHTQVKLFDQLGRVVFRQGIAGHSPIQQINIGDLANGIYYLLVSGNPDNEPKVKKVIIQH